MTSRVDVVRAVRELPALASVAANTLRVLDDPGSSATRVGDFIAADPSLLVNVLRVANSPMLGRSRITEPGQAVAMIGWAGVRAVVTTAALRLAGPSPDWQHAVTSASCAALLADGTEVPVLEAFTTGLLHDIGRAVRRELASGSAAAFDHAQLGGIALEVLAFPPLMVDAVTHHHADGDVAGRPLAAIVCAANHLAHVVDETDDSVERLARLDAALLTAGHDPADLGRFVRHSKALAAEYAALALG